MKKALQNTKNNWLLYFGGIFLLISIILIFFIYEKDNFISSRDIAFDKMTLPLFAICVILIAPIFEELSFRGFFTNKKWLTIIAFIGLPVCVIFSTSNNYFSWISLGVFFVLFYWNYKKPSKQASVLLIILSSLLFAFMHYEVNDFQSINTYIGFIYKFSLGLVAIWVTQNFGLTKSMLFHAFNNSIAILLLIFSLQFVDTSKQKYEDNNISVTWSRVPIFENGKGVLSMSDKTIEATNTSFSSFYNGWVSNDSIAISTERFMKYNFNVKTKNKDLDLVNNTEILPKILKDFLIKEKLIILKK